MRKILRRAIPIGLIVVVVAIFAWWYFGPNKNGEESNSLITASGTIEATQVTLSPEIGGQVVEVLAQAGELVKSGSSLIKIDDHLLRAQFEQAVSAVQLAQANFDYIASGPTSEERQVAISAAELELIAARQKLNELNNTANLSIKQVEQNIATLEKVIENAEEKVEYFNSVAYQIDLEFARAQAALAERELEKVNELFEPWIDEPEDDPRRAELLAQKSTAQHQYDSAIRKLDSLEGNGYKIELALAESDLSLAQAQLEDALNRYEKIKDGPDPNDIALAEAQITLAEAHLQAALSEPSREQLAVSQAQLDSARSALNVIQVQIDKLQLTAPMDGIILSRSVEPGEVVLPGASLMTLANLDDLSMTVYVPEDRYGAIRIGQVVEVTTDSFPTEKFTGVVAYIADEAEFTPRNVQTSEGRRTTVFAVQLKISNPQSKLKPGMPADVIFKE